MIGAPVSWTERCEMARSVPMTELMRRLGLGESKKCGKQLLMRCPFHADGRPSFYIDPQRGLWNCFGCGLGGDRISLWMQSRQVGFAEAVREIVP